MRYRRALRDVGVGLMGFVLILALSYTLGRVSFVAVFRLEVDE